MPDQFIDDGQAHEYPDALGHGIIGEGVVVFQAPQFPGSVMIGISMTGDPNDPMPVVPMTTIDALAIAGNIRECVKDIESQ